ncbi:NERD domain-containing protein [Rossellomorea aquimaris]|uniref:nuclease-related domain-containing protein n=1 Tax=Rossellomorea aquimaris TaxID=189382 RepID=UPI001CD62587|nr:nuclease-related domain-containing protein [Rossellomorea aquimaris]MCA1056110.1 NERD domain-containing protein [Rossellomorea aquimaris]
MILKERTIPIKILENEALLTRLDPFHESKPLIELDLKKRKAGFNGEKAVDYHLSFLTGKHYWLFFDIRLPLAPHYFQIDTILLTPYYILAIEVKNVSGIIRIDPHIKQCTRIYKDSQEGFIDPISQARRQTHFLQKWLSLHKIPPLPIEYLVVISNPSTTIEYTSRPEAQSPYLNIIHSQSVIDRIIQLNSLYKMKALDDKTLKKIKKLILTHHEDIPSKCLQTYNLKKEEILPGVQCEHCGHLPLKRTRNSWHCDQCSRQSPDSVLKAIDDYFLLVDTKLTSRELRRFLCLPSRKVATGILQTAGLIQNGAGKGTFYTKP